MTISEITEVRARLEKAVQRLHKAANPQEKYDQFEMVAIQILDSEFINYPDGLLQEYLTCYLRLKRFELGVND
jgi:hypothetical protein